MPELPEVEVVRRGLADHVVGRRVVAVRVLDGRSLRRHVAGPDDFIARLVGRTVASACRRGKYLWLPLAGADQEASDALLAHLGMSGQMLISEPDAPPQKHLKVTLDLDDGAQLRFVDQRIFGGLSLSEALVVDERGAELPREIAHIAPDPLDPVFFDVDAFAARLKRRQTGIKRALLDQSLISGVGNIYADEALWRVPLHYARDTRTLRRPDVDALVGHVTDVMAEALAQGGTSFDALYVNVNGASGYFDRSLQAYGREAEPCERCGTAIVREKFMNRSSHFCPLCQPRPRNGRF